MEYLPEYEPGKIIVFFHEKKGFNSDEFMKGFGSYIGYEFIEEWRWANSGSTAVYKVPEGEEEKIRKQIGKKYSKFIENTDRIDAKFNRRTDNIESVVNNLQEINDNVEIPDDDYNDKLRSIIKKLENYIEK